MKSFRVQPADALGGALGDAVGDATGAIADATGAISTAMHAWTPATFSPPLLGLRAERAVDYVGEKASMFSFFTNFYTIILRKRGSALPKIMIEIILATGLGVVAFLLTEDGICGKHGAEKCKGFFLPPSTSRAVWKSNLRRVRPRHSTRHLLDGVAKSVSHRSTEPARPRHRRETFDLAKNYLSDTPDTLVDFHTGRAKRATR